MGLESFLNSITPAVKLFSEVSGKNKAYKVAKAGNVPTQAETQQNALFQALLDPNSPLLRRLAEEQRMQGMSDLQSGIRERQLADRREVSMGRTPTFFNPERADEAVSFLTSRGMPGVSALANEQARQRIMSAATGYGGLMPTQVARQQQGTQLDVSRANYGSTVPPQILDILKGLTQNKTQKYDPRLVPKPVPYGPQLPIIWDTPKAPQLNGYRAYGQYGQYGSQQSNPFQLLSSQMRY